MHFIDLVNKCFVGGEWIVGYRPRGSSEFKTINVENGWIADPFLFEYQNEHYLFVEYVNSRKGEIAYYKFIHGKPVFQKVVLSEKHHLSYPCVFIHENDIYMIPESADNRSIDLYKAINFPEKWEKVKQLQNGVFYDTTYVRYQGNDYLISYCPKRGFWELDVFSFDIPQRQVNLISKKKYLNNVGRPAGRLFIENGNLLRPAQDCSRNYGKKILFYQVSKLDQKQYEEKLTRVLSVEDTNLSYQRIHTYNFDEVYETTDFFKECFQPFRLFGLIYKKAKQRIGFKI